MTTEKPKRRRPVEAIEQRSRRTAECEQRVRVALAKLAKTGAPFTIENVCDLAGVGRTFIYDKRRPELTQAVLRARSNAQAAAEIRAEQKAHATETASWMERAISAEALAKSLRKTVRDRDERISDLTGQLFDPDGNHLAERNAELRTLNQALNQQLRNLESDTKRLQRSLDAARANVKRERERNVASIFGDGLTVAEPVREQQR